MRTISKTHQNLRPLAFTILFTLLLWLGSKWWYGDAFENLWKYPAKAASLTATTLMAWSVLLAARIPVLEDMFGGLDKVYQVHKRAGRTAFFVILLHPCFLAADRLPEVPAFLARLWLLPADGDRYLLGHNLGVVTLAGMTLLILATFWARLPYHRWKRSHEWFGLVLLLAIAHVVMVDRDVTRYPLLRVWLYGLLALAVAAFLHIRLLYRFFGPCFRYAVDATERVGDVLELTLAPQGRKMDFRPSQFVYLVFHRPDITPEPHPYSIACGYNLDGRLKFGIKMAGDHTRTLSRLAKGDRVTVYGPYGRFSDAFLRAERDCVFVGAGIGITPFLGMWHVAMHSEERLPRSEVSERLTRLHPEIIVSWKSPRVFLFYVSRTEAEASFDNDIKNEVILSHFHGFRAFTERGHRYELHCTARQGRLTGADIAARVPGGLADKLIFLCGPSVMVAALSAQLQGLGVPPERIVVEDFNLF